MEIGIVVTFIAALIVFAPFISTLTRIPIIVVEMLLGVFGAYIGILGDIKAFEIVAHIGFLYLMFLAGMEVNLKEFQTKKEPLLRRTVIYFVLIYLLSIFSCLYFELGIVYVITFPIFSIGVLMALVKEYGKNELWLNLALNIGIVGELLSIIAIAILSGSLNSGFDTTFFIHMAALVMFLVAFVSLFKILKVLFWWFPELKIFLMPLHDNKDTDIRLSMALMFAFVGVMMILSIDKVLGAFLAGLFIRTFFRHKTELPEKLSSFGFGFLIPIFFIYVGSTIPVDTFFDKEILTNALFICFMIFIVRFLSSFVSFAKYLKVKNTILFSLSTSMPLTFLVAIATVAHSGNLISNGEYYSFILASMINAVVFMILIKIFHKFFQKEICKK
ncbi:MAG: cation:proton antiporter [Campylobacteraceae bacterium]|nr:cation:proton antiporter [Campylobacteraceae bacterium]